jgi:hypothetical protein
MNRPVTAAARVGPMLPAGDPRIVGIVNITEDSFSDGGRAEIEQCGVLERDGALPVTVVGIYKLDAAGKLARIHGDMDMAIFIAFGLRRHASMMLDKKSKSRATLRKRLSIR